VVVAACTPKTHEPLFQETLTSAGINKYLFEMTNIRNQCSWVTRTIRAANPKSEGLVRMSVAKAALLEPLPEPKLEINSRPGHRGGIAEWRPPKTWPSRGSRPSWWRRRPCGGNAAKPARNLRGEDVQGQLARWSMSHLR